MCIINENKIDVQPSEQLKVYKSVVHGVGIIRWRIHRAMNIQTFL